ncbi:MAG: N-acetylmuramoyl-L-alanine amidase [Eubacteriales bacterium]|nr:N-acetylmuramoyl-L-alanine amidase [Eubacteriales bacterium]MDD3880906.1 N-acetylmuramoyl-L-alanine amidase [Eubacteriales bacterium]MDD4511727.1 N-acetylmuramoyl-L-alanine amidase [Eubacteriales bacterium]
MRMSGTLWMISLLLCIALLTGLCAPAAAEDAAADFQAEWKENGIEFAFSAPDYPFLQIEYSSKFSSGIFALLPTDGKFSGSIPLAFVHPGMTVKIKINTADQKTIAEFAPVSPEFEPYPAAEKAESGSLSGVTVCIDPGHQSEYVKKLEPRGPGLSGSKTTVGGMARGKYTLRRESIVMLQIGLLLRDELLSRGADVVMTREVQNAGLDNLKRAGIANDANADYFLRLHADNADSKKSNGIRIFSPYSSTYAKELTDAKTYSLWANTLLDAIKNATGQQKGYAKLNNTYVGNNWAKMPAFLIELGYMSNAVEDELLSTPQYQQLLAEGITDGIEELEKLKKQ